MKFSAAILILALAAGGCTTRDKAAAEQRAAYIAGQNAALREQQQTSQMPGVTVVGPVRNPRVPWVAGLTLAQAIATADYLDPHGPEAIVITRQGESTTLDPAVLLNGQEVPLEPGDVIVIQP
jgi:protein involved in polysaccharide export with SLBB domain